MLDTGGLPCKYVNTGIPPNTLHLSEELHCGKARRFMATAIDWPFLWAGQLTTDAQFEAKAKVKKLKKQVELKRNMLECLHLLTSGLADKGWEGEDVL